MQATPTGRAIAWFLLIALGAANVAGYAFDLYQQFWWFDRVLHACTILALTLWLALFVFDEALNGRVNQVILTLLIASVGLAIGSLWEVAEWTYDQFAPTNVIKGKHDTMLDVVMDTAGAVLAAVLALRVSRPHGPERTR